MSALTRLPIRKNDVQGNLAQARAISDWKNVPQDWRDRLGFVYIIKNQTNGRFYVGKKLFWKSNGKINNRRVRSESDWRKYWGSSKELVADIKAHGKENFTREIIECHDSKSALALAELCWQLHLCLQNELAYNGILNIRLPISKAMREITYPWIIANDKNSPNRYQ